MAFFIFIERDFAPDGIENVKLLVFCGDESFAKADTYKRFSI